MSTKAWKRAHIAGYREAETARRRASRATSPAVDLSPGQELKGQSILLGADGALKGRWDKSHTASVAPNHAPVPPGHLVRKTTTAYGPDGKARLQYVTSSRGEVDQWVAFWEACKVNAGAYRKLALPSASPKHAELDLMTLYALGDPHLGMFSWAPETGQDFEIRLATDQLLECVTQLVAGAPAAGKATILNLGDFFHAQDDSQLTPGHGNKLDVDSRFAKIMGAGHSLLRGIVDLALQKHPSVEIVNLPGNHDPRVAYELAAWLGAVYEREPRVTVAPAFSPFWYSRFGSNLLGACHGDGPKAAALPGIMATDRPQDWGAALYRYWHCGHIHHTEILEYPGCLVEYHNTFAPKDAWHHFKGYRARQMLKGITYHSQWGETQRHTVGLERVLDSLTGKT